MADKPVNKHFLDREVTIGGLGLARIALFAKNMAVMLKAGLPITEALAIAQDSAEGKLKRILGNVLGSVEAGRSLSEALAAHPKVFSRVVVGAVYAGELSGTLEGNLENVAEELEKEKELIAKIKGAMIYPVFILIATFILGMGLAFFVLPKITPLFRGLKVELPATTRALIWVSDLVQRHGVLLFVSIVAGIFFLTWLLRRKFMRPITHWALLNFPIVRSITRNANLARFCRTLGTLLKSGINIDRAIEIARSTANNYYYEHALGEVGRRIGKGTTLSQNLKLFEREFPVLITRMIRVGEQSGKLEETLLYLAGFYEVEVNTAVKALGTAIEPMLLLVVGIIVGGLALSIITPIYDITGNIRR